MKEGKQIVGSFDIDNKTHPKEQYITIHTEMSYIKVARNDT